MSAEETAWHIVKLVEENVTGASETRRYQSIEVDLPLQDPGVFWRNFPVDESAFRTYVISLGISLSGNVGTNMDTMALLPVPPEGYYWALNSGGLRMGRNHHTFRLWYRDPVTYGPPGVE